MNKKIVKVLLVFIGSIFIIFQTKLSAVSMPSESYTTPGTLENTLSTGRLLGIIKYIFILVLVICNIYVLCTCKKRILNNENVFKGYITFVILAFVFVLLTELVRVFIFKCYTEESIKIYGIALISIIPVIITIKILENKKKKQEKIRK